MNESTYSLHVGGGRGEVRLGLWKGVWVKGVHVPAACGRRQGGRTKGVLVWELKRKGVWEMELAYTDADTAAHNG